MMRKISLFLVATLAFSGYMISHANADARSEMEDATAQLSRTLPAAYALLEEGRLDEAEAIFLATFPEANRTGPQNYALGEMFYSVDEKVSYAFHRRAASALRGVPEAEVAWAMEQHRAGQYAGALYRFDESLKGPHIPTMVEGLRAECLIRLGKTREAVDAWMKMTGASNGRLETFEKNDWFAHLHPFVFKKRQDLIRKAKSGDVDAAEQLIAFDARSPRDWWIIGPEVKYLKYDLRMLRGANFKEPQIKEILCAGECCIAPYSEGSPADVLRKYGLLLDDAATLPKSGRMLSVMLDTVLDTKVPSETARQKWGPQILEELKTSKDPGLFATAEAIYLRTDQRMAIDQQGWDATGEARFADSVLIQLDEQGKLTTDDPLLVKAEQQFPDDAVVARIVFEHTRKEGKPIEPALIKAIEAEYSHFSCPPSSDRPSAFRLNQYFGMLDQVLKQQ